ncbi:MAG TPA: PKD domain-containing protein [Cyclobacteriaceae bacterium]
MVKRAAVLAIVYLCFPAVSSLAENPALEFIENRNQWDEGIDYGVRIPGGMLYLDGTGFHYYLYDQVRLEELHMASHEHADESTGPRTIGEKIDGQYIRMTWTGARDVQPEPFGKNLPYYNYFLGRDPSRHASRVPSYSGVLYPGIYDGIDLKVYALGANLKYDFIVAPGADPSRIQGVYSGVDGVKYDGSGGLLIPNVAGELIETRPYAYQIIAGQQVPVACEYVLRDTVMSFAFPEGYDACEPLIIDPLLIFSTYSGSTADNWGSTATPGEHGMLYSSGVTNLAGAPGTFPVKPGVFQTSYGGWFDVGILKYDSTGHNLVYASYLGGVASDSPHSLVMDPATNDLLVLGTTSSADFPVTTGALDTTFAGGAGTANVIEFFNGADIFIARISADGTRLRASTFFGGAFNDGLNDTFAGLSRNYGDELRGDIITDAAGDVYISSVTASSDLQLVNSFSTAFHGGATDAIVVKFSRDLDQQLWGAFLGGGGADAAYTLKLTENGDVLVAGGTTSTNFTTTPGAYQETYGGATDGWIARISSDGQALLQETYTGTSSYDQIYFLDINTSEEVYVYGQTAAPDFPVSPGVYSNPHSGQFVQKFSTDLSTLVFSTVFGSGRGIPDISPTAFLVNECNNLYMAGWGGIVNSQTNHWQSNTFGMPTTPDAFQSTTSGSDFYFMVLTSDASEFLYGTFLGGTSSRTHVDGGTSRFDKGGIVYHAVCAGCEAFNALDMPTSDFPTTPGAWSNRNRSPNCNNAAFKFDLASLRARIQTNSEKFDAPNIRKVCLPDAIVFQNRSVGGETFRWDFGDGTEVVKTDTNMMVHRYTAPGRYLVKLVAIDPGTCIGSDSTQLFIDVFMHQGVVQDDDALCQGTPYTLEASGGTIYHWMSEDGSFVSHDARPKVTPDTTTRYFVTVTEANGCVLRDTVDLRVIPRVEPDFQIFQRGQCLDRPALEVVNLTPDATDTQMVFDFGDGATSEQGDELHVYAEDGLYNVSLRSVREFCVFEKVSPVPVYSVRIPNVITPNETPGYNDKFTILFGDTGDQTPADFGIRVNLVVYNRWGTKVYESDDYQYDWGGEDLPLGTYFYEVTIGERAVCKSWLEIL